ncbi:MULTISPECIES: hypothetical protein [unclassified Paenibacillus]|uniref:hypothetical protein n=1 Tax=unclassified Paenibacillus TaxID=185978 RepID=UPI003627CEF7
MEMNSLADIAKKLYQMSDQMHEGMADGVHKTATRVVSNAKNRLGHYQDGWAKLKEKTVQRKLRKNVKAVIRAKKKGAYTATGTDSDAPLIDDGLLRASITVQTNRRHLQSEVGSPIIQAATHEFGNEERGIPERPYLRPALKEEVHKHFVNDLRDGILKRVTRG